MAMIKFKSTKTIVRYNGTHSFVDGEQKDIPDDAAIRLLDDFPENFTEVKESESEKSVKPKKDKMFRSDKDK